jgi:hypothetical protein
MYARTFLIPNASQKESRPMPTNYSLKLQLFIDFLEDACGVEMTAINLRYYTQQFVQYEMDGVRDGRMRDNSLVAFSVLNDQ